MLMQQGVFVMLIKHHKQLGFALIDVMVASLVLAVGVIAFVKLQNLSVQRSGQTNYRLQAAGSAETLVELMRGNRNLVAWATDSTGGGAGGAFIVQTKDNVKKALNKLKCDIKDNADATVTTNKEKVLDNSKWCATNSDKIRDELFAYANSALSENFRFIDGKAVMCVQAISTSIDDLMPVRIVVIWKNATSSVDYTAASANDCPTSYDTAVTIGGESTDRPDRGFIEVFTKI